MVNTKNGTAGLVGMLALCAAQAVACRALPDCGDGSEVDGLLCPEAAAGGAGGGGGSGGSGGVPPSACIPSEAGEPVASDCGVFVSSSAGNDGNAGSREAPLRTLGTAIGLAADLGKPVYVCAEELSEDAGVTVPAGISIYGGLDCGKGWGYAGSAARTTLTAPAGVVPLRLKGGEGTVRVADLHVRAAPAEIPGGSSIAVLVDGVSAAFLRSVLEAGEALAGADAAPYGMSAAGGAVGTEGGAACSAMTVGGATGPVNACGDEDSVGGDGGAGFSSSGAPGFNGLPAYTMNGGAGESLAAPCAAGLPGDGGEPGAAGADGLGLGAIDSTGFVGAAGAAGTAGKPGQGGGGGGGARGGGGVGGCPMGSPTGGASGGSGGSGGCGGAGGKGGGSGGSSIALVSLNATVSFESTELIAKSGGKGGAGGVGQDGGKGAGGGAGGTASAGILKDACGGGAGGDGGKGGPGGGGAGGHSIGIAFKGSAPPVEGRTITIGTAGLGGGMADPGVAIEAQEFP